MQVMAQHSRWGEGNGAVHQTIVQYTEVDNCKFSGSNTCEACETCEARGVLGIRNDPERGTTCAKQNTRDCIFAKRSQRIGLKMHKPCWYPCVTLYEL